MGRRVRVVEDVPGGERLPVPGPLPSHPWAAHAVTQLGRIVIPAIHVDLPQTCEVAGNIVDTSFGNGILTTGGKSSGSYNVVPLTRILVHHNQLDNTMREHAERLSRFAAEIGEIATELQEIEAAHAGRADIQALAGRIHEGQTLLRHLVLIGFLQNLRPQTASAGPGPYSTPQPAIPAPACSHWKAR